MKKIYFFSVFFLLVFHFIIVLILNFDETPLNNCAVTETDTIASKDYLFKSIR